MGIGVCWSYLIWDLPCSCYKEWFWIETLDCYIRSLKILFRPCVFIILPLLFLQEVQGISPCYCHVKEEAQVLYLVFCDAWLRRGPFVDRNGIQGLQEGSTDILAGKGQGTSFFRGPHVASVDTVGRWPCDCWLSTSPLWYHPCEGEVGLSQHRLVEMKVQAPHMFFPDTGK